MSVEEPKDGGAVDTTSGAGSEKSNDNTDGLKSALDKAVTREKNLKARAADLQAQLDRMEQDKLAAEGNKDELITKLQQRVNESEQELKKRDADFAWTAVTSQIQAKAADMGCVNTESLIKLATDDLQAFDGIGEDFKVDEDKLKGFLEEQSKKHSYLFQPKKVNVQGVTPGGAPLNNQKSLNEMTAAEKLQLFKAVASKK